MPFSTPKFSHNTLQQAPSKLYKFAALGLLVLVLLFAFSLPWLVKTSSLSSSIDALLPSGEQQALEAKLEQQLLTQLDKQLVWLVGVNNKDIAAVTAWYQQLASLDGLTQLEGKLAANTPELWRAYQQKFLPALLNQASLDRLNQGAARVTQEVISQVYSPLSQVSLAELTADPLLLIRSLNLATQAEQKFSLIQGWLSVTDANDRRWFLIQARTNFASGDYQASQKLVAQLKSQQASWQTAWPDAEIVSQGAIFYVAAASSAAEKDVKFLGSFILIAVAALVFWAFKSVMPLVFAVLSVAVGVLSGLWAVLVIFKELHLLLLVMSLSVIGVSIDYVIYFLTQLKQASATANKNFNLGFYALNISLPTLNSALITTLLAYALLLFLPLPLFKHLAVFTLVGMSCAFLVVVLWLPFLSQGMPTASLTPASPANSLITTWLTAWQQPVFKWLGVLIIFAFAALGLARLEINDDPAKFQTLPQHLKLAEQQMASLLGTEAEHTWLLVSGATLEMALQSFEAVEPQLIQAQQTGVIAAYTQPNLTSLAKQQANLAVLTAIYPKVGANLVSQGLLNQPPQLPNWQKLTYQQWLASPAATFTKELIYVDDQGVEATGVLIPLRGITAASQLQKLLADFPQVKLIDRKQAFIVTFSQYRTKLSWFLLMALGVISGYFLFSLGLKQGLKSLMPTWLSLLAAPAVLGYLNQPFSLLTLIAMLLVLGVGINYTLFFNNKLSQPITAFFASALAAATTLLTLGILVLSSTQVISNFGWVLATGLLVAFITAPLASYSSKATTHV